MSTSILESIRAVIAINEKHVISGKPEMKKIWADTLEAEGTSVEHAQRVAKARMRFGHAFTEGVGSAVIEHMNAHAEVDTLGFDLETDDITFGFHQTRPQGDVITLEQVNAGMVSRFTITADEEFENTRSRVAGLWDLSD